jgi:ferredoxin-NADP reductase
MSPLRIIDNFLNGITMYRLVLYGLAVVAAVAVFFGFDGQLAYSGWELLASLSIVLSLGYGINKLLAAVWDAQANAESSLITGLILFFIMAPPASVTKTSALIVAILVAMASKYILATSRKHIFNPAAIAAIIVGLSGLGHATWWVATPVLLPCTTLLGLLVIRKIRRVQLFVLFVTTVLAVMTVIGLAQGNDIGQILRQVFTSWPLIFMGTIMLTEPSTMPARHFQQMFYGLVVGVIFSSQLRLGPISSTPEVALAVGNLYAFVVGQKAQLRLRFKDKTKLSSSIYDFSFIPEKHLPFLAGQYAEWTLPHKRVDSRGNRRTFTIASNPRSSEVHIGIRLAQQSSSFKRALMEMRPGDEITIGQFAGNFVLPADSDQKLALIAGGIGITPFLSMLEFLVDVGEVRDVVLVHLVNSPQDIGYDKALSRFAKHGIRVISVARTASAGYKGLTGELDVQALRREVPDYRERSFYLSGPHGMVAHYQDLLQKAGVKRSSIATDHFSGY